MTLKTSSLAAISFLLLAGTAHAADVTTIYVGGGNATIPSSFLDENNALTGYDIDVLKAADELLEAYTFTFQPLEFTALFAGLDAGRIDIAASSLQPSAERAAKYDFSVGYINSNSYVTYLDGRTDIASVDDLQGKSVEAWARGSSDFVFFTDYNAAHPSQPVNIVVGGGDPAIIVKNLLDKRTDAYVANDQTRLRMSREYDVALGYLPDPIKSGQVVYILRKGNVGLQEALNGALKTLATNGTLASLSEKWFGGDFTQGATEK